MKTEQATSDPRCPEIRQLLPAFMQDRLGIVATGEMQGHLLTCEECSEAYGELLLEEAVSDLGSLRPPRGARQLPPASLYDNYLRARSGQFGQLGTMWSSLRDARESADTGERERARARMEQIGRALCLLVLPAVVVHRQRAVRTRGNGPGRGRAALSADVLSAAWEPTGETASFIVEEPPKLSAAGHFRLRLRTEDAGYEGCTVICSVRLPEPLTVSFSAKVERVAGEEAWSVLIDEEAFAHSPGEIPLEAIKLSLVEME